METENQTNQQENNNFSPYGEMPVRKSKGNSTALTLKGLLIAVLILFLLIPTFFISDLVSERLKRQEEVKEEVFSKWASAQTLSGPYLLIPYMEKETILKGKDSITEYKRSVCTILPEMLNVSGNITPQDRHRSIFNVTVYQSKLNFEGTFSAMDLKSWPENLLLNEAQVYFELSDFRGLEEQLKIKWDNKELLLNAENPLYESFNHGLMAPVNLTAEEIQQKHTFSFTISLKGSEDLMLTPIGKTTTTHLASTWKNPSFIGNFIPDTPSDISDTTGFKADWKILNLNRLYPQVWKGVTYNVSESAYGVKLLQPTDSYAQTKRSVKYAILFIALTFALYFFIEIFQKRKVHPLQYILVGIALCVFYVLLLSISEYIKFSWAYLIASIAIVSLITLYTKSAFGKWKVAAVFGLVLAGLYGFIYILIQLQDGALLFGSIGLFVLLAIIMYYSRKIDWYGQSLEN